MVEVYFFLDLRIKKNMKIITSSRRVLMVRVVKSVVSI